MTRNKWNAVIEAILVMRSNVDNDTAIACSSIYPEWKPGEHYSAGDRLLFNDTLFTCLQPHQSISSWIPEAAPSLFAPVLPGQAGTQIGEWRQPDSTNLYMTGDKVLFNGEIYVSLVDNNCWPPNVYGWSKQV